MKSKTMKQKMVKSKPSAMQDPSYGRAAFVAVAFAAVFAAGILVYLKVSHYKETESIKTEAALSDSELRAKKAINAKLPMLKQNMVRPSLEEIKGQWFTVFHGHSIAEVTLGDAVFEIIYTPDAQGRQRKYSRGVYYYDPKLGMLSLRPDRKMGEPAEIPGVRYKVLTMRPFTFYVLKEAESYDLHFTALEEDVAAKQFHPLFLYADYAGAPVLKFSPTEIK